MFTIKPRKVLNIIKELNFGTEAEKWIIYQVWKKGNAVTSR